MALSIDDLFATLTRDQVTKSMLAVATALGLKTTAWQAGSVGRTVQAVFA